MTLFGEGPAERRDRLRELLTTAELLRQQAQADGGEEGGPEIDMTDAPQSSSDEEAEGEDKDEEFYSRGEPGLLEARQEIARFSLPRAKRRVAFQRAEAEIPLRTHIKFRKQIKERLQAYELQGSQTVGDRNISMARISPDGSTVAVGNWGGSIRLVEVPTLEVRGTLRRHTSNIGGLSWYPGATLSVPRESLSLASGAADGNVALWSLTQDTPLATLTGHTARVCRVEFHPMGRFLASASEDTSWRLWDVEAQKEVLLQEGHSRGVYAVSFNTDGSLLASAGTDSIGRIWDLRSGRTVMILDEHIKGIHGLDWGADGHRVLTGSADGWVKCWDVRKVARTATIGAHASTVADVRWFKGLDDPLVGVHGPGSDDRGNPLPKKAGTFFVSAGFDRQIKIFSADDWTQVQTLSGHTSPVTCVDVSADARWIVSGSHDRTLKLWGRADGSAL
jgi:U4/U6 small nuclear ribonucleoprotein PRP4